MRIAMFTETFLPGTDGVITRLLATLRYLSEEGHEVLLFAPAGGPETYASAKVVGLPTFRFFLYPEKPFAFPRRIVGTELKEFQPDLIHVVNPAFLGLGGIYYARKWKIPLIASFHTNVPAYARHYHLDFLEPILWWYFRFLHNRAVMNLCTSRAMQAELVRQRFKEVGLWERGVDVQLYSTASRSEEMRRRLMGDATDKSDHRLLLYVGRLASEKGLEKLRGLLDRDANLHLAIVGDGPHRRPLEQAFAGSQTRFIGYLHGQDLAQAYASADTFVFPSTTETLGLVLFEAMASGLPIMAGKSDPTLEVLEEGAAGVIFNPDDVTSIYDAAQCILYDDTVRNRVRNRGQEIAAGLDWEGPTRQLLGHYQRVVAERVKLGHAVRDGRSQRDIR